MPAFALSRPAAVSLSAELSATGDLAVEEDPYSFATGGGTGTLVGDVWTPAKAPDGRVYAESWAIVPTNTWTRVVGSNMDALDTLIKAQMPTWAELQSWDTYNDSWSGMASDMSTGRMFLFAGGHNNGSNNGIYSFNLYRGIWGIEMLPSDQTLWTTEYKTGSSTGGLYYEREPDSARALNADAIAGTPTPINGWCQDEISWDHGTGVGKKAAKHSYDSYVYVPETNELVFMLNRLWRFSLDSGAYTYKRHFNDDVGASRGDYPILRYPILDPEHGFTCYDESTGDVLTSAAGSSSYRNRFAYNLSADTWALNPTSYNPPWKDSGTFCATRVGRNIVAIILPKSGFAGSYHVFSLDSRTETTTGASFQYGAGLTNSASFSTDFDASGIEYIPSINRYWMYTRLTGGAMAYIEVDPTTTPWTLTKKTDFAGAVPVGVEFGCKRMFWHADTNSVWMYGATSAGWHVYKF